MTHENMIVRSLMVLSLFFLFGSSTVLAQNVHIIPKPKEVINGNGFFTVNQQTKIVSSADSNASAHVLKTYIERRLDYEIDINETSKSKTETIEFVLDQKLDKEAYKLMVSKNGIQIIASTNTGWFYGIQSLIQLFPSDSSDKISDVKIPSVTINDAPRFSWRAFMLDEARYFKGMEQVKALLDEMALLKMNVFHWHLTDDQGWRIEIKKYPRLTEIGSKRKSTQVGPLKWDSPINSAEPHEGFYTQEQITEIVEYAKERHITIVPEIEMPGHSVAAIASYNWLGTVKNEVEVPITFGVSADLYDVSDPKVFKFLTDVLDEVMELFPSEVIHIGGDEVKYDHWKASKAINSYMKENKIDSYAGLQVHFTNKISQYIQSKGRRMMGWNEIMGSNLHHYQDDTASNSSQQLAKETVVHFWTGDLKLATQAASNGYDIVNSISSHTYLDYGYNNIPLSKAYVFDPVPKNLDPKYQAKIIGLGCQMWGEWIPTIGHMQFQVFPRIAAYAEVGWTEKRIKNFEEFKESLKKLQIHWKEKGIYYAPDSVVEKTAE